MPRLAKNIEMNERYKDDYKMNSMLRKRFREETKQLEVKGMLFGDSDTKVRIKDLDDYDLVSSTLSRGL